MLRFVIGVLVGATAVLVANPKITERVRPVAKSGLKAAMKALYSARVGGAEAYEAAEDLYAEAKNEVATEIFAEAMAAAPAKAAAASADTTAREAAPAEGAKKSGAQRAKRAAPKRRSSAPAGHA